MNLGRSSIAALLLAASSTLAVGCAAQAESTDDTTDNDLTSNSALSRTVSFQGRVYVSANAADWEVKSAIERQTQTAFGPLRTSNIAVNNRELKGGVDQASIKKRAVTVVNGSQKTAMQEVTYVYKDNGVVAKSYARRSSAPIALLNPNYGSQINRIVSECTANDSEAHEFSGSIWYVFEPSVGTCSPAMKKEQTKIAADRQKLANPATEVTQSQVDQLYIPATVKLGSDKTNKGQSYPDYQRLYAGGVQKDKLVVGLVYGLIDHDNTNGPAADSNYHELMTHLDEVTRTRPGFKIVKSEPAADFSSYTLKSGKKVTGITLQDLIRQTIDGTAPKGLSSADADDLGKQAAMKFYQHYVTIEATETVSINNEPARNFAVAILAYYGAETDNTPHKKVIKNSDVFLYNGHSYIGFGPLDPSNFTADDFPSSYQIMFVDGCVSYNYYEKDYIPLKAGGTQNLDLITNGIEAPAWRSGYALGRFTDMLLDGKGESYATLLQAASDTDSLRVVDGELDNQFTPAKFNIKVTAR
jgi:hypothetical protein